MFLIGPNYAAGKDMLAGVASTFKGKVVGQELTTWPAQLDFSAELSKAKAANPDAIFVFYPGKAGVQFLTQYAQAGFKGKIPLVHRFHHRRIVTAAAKRTRARRTRRAGMGERSAERRQQEVRGRLQGKYRARPSFYGAQSYDAANLIASAVAATKGNMSDKEALRKAIEKADFKSVRGDFKFGNNHVADPELLSAGRGEGRQGRLPCSRPSPPS